MEKSYFDINAAVKFLEIERLYYTEILDKAHAVTTYEFGEQDWYFELEQVYNFYDEHGNYFFISKFCTKNGLPILK